MKTETKAKFTRGPWTVEVYNPQHGSTRSRQIELWGELSSGGPARIATMETDAVENGRDYADACLMAYAGTSATQLEDAGYDALEALRALPEIVEALTGGLFALRAAPCNCNDDRDCQRCFASRKLRAVLAKIGKGEA